MLIRYILLIYMLYPFSVETKDSENKEKQNTSRFNVWGMYFFSIHISTYNYIIKYICNI